MLNAHQQALLIYGASGHAKVLIDIVERAGLYRITGIVDDNRTLWGQELLEYPIIGGFSSLDNQHTTHIIIAIGSNTIRERLGERLTKQGFSFAQAIHPSASLGRTVTLGKGCVIMAGTVINPDSRIGNHVIINTCASIDHDCCIGTACHIAPGAHICGGVTIGERTLIGAGATVIPNISIGYNVIIGAGATVVNDIPDNAVALGTPARVVKYHE